MSKKQIDVYRTGIYLRLSQGDEDIDGLEKKESNSISNQKLLLEGFIDAHDDLKLVDIFIDDGYSGSNFDRPEFQRMMASMKEGNLDCIIVKDLSRLARERIGADELIQKTFKKYNVRFIAVSEGYDSLTASSSETHTIIPFKNLLNEQYNGDTSIKVRTSQGILRRNGLFIGAFAPYGYQKAEDNKNHLVPDPYAAGVVQGIFAKKLSGMSASGIAKILNKNGVLAPSEYKAKCGEKYSTSFKGAGQSKWSAQTVSRILKNVVYIGTLAQGKRTTVSHKVKKEIAVPECDWVVVENAHEAIINKEDFEKVAAMRKENTCASAKRKYETHCLTGKMICGNCGHRLSHTYAGRPKYYCANHYLDKTDEKCNISVLDVDMERVVKNALQMMIDVLVDSRKVVDMQREKQAERLKQAEKHLSDMEHSRELIEKDLREAYESYKLEMTDKETYLEQRKIYEQMLERLHENIEKQRAAVTKMADVDVPEVAGLEMLEGQLKLTGLNREMVDAFVEEIVVYAKDRVERKWKFRDEFGEAGKARKP